MSSTDELKREAKDARDQLVGAVGELGGIARDARSQATDTVKHWAPIVGGAVAGLILLRVAGGRRGRKQA